jgi:hypothetical protein
MWRIAKGEFARRDLNWEVSLRALKRIQLRFDFTIPRPTYSESDRLDLP